MIFGRIPKRTALGAVVSFDFLSQGRRQALRKPHFGPIVRRDFFKIVKDTIFQKSDSVEVRFLESLFADVL